MKKILSFTLVLIMIFTFPAFCQAVKINTNIVADPVNGCFYVKGFIDNETKGNIPIGLIIKNEKEEIIRSEQTFAQKKDGKISFEFDNLNMADEMQTGNYTFYIGSFVGSDFLTVQYLNIESLLGILKELEHKNEAEYLDIIRKNYGGLGIDFSCYENLSQTNKSLFMEIMQKKQNYNLGEVTVETPNYVLLTKTALKSFINDYNETLAVCSWNDCKSQKDLENWILKHNSFVKLEKDNPTTSYDEMTIYNLYNDGNLKNEIALLSTNKSDYKTLETVRNKFYESVLIATLNNSHISKVEYLINSYYNAFGIVINDYQSLEDKNYVNENIIGKNFTTYSQMKAEFNRLVAIALSNQSTQTGGGGSSSGGGGSNGSVSMGNNKPLEETKIFNDLDYALWAKDAIMYLYDKKIINGKSPDTFSPNDNITRAEFIKIAVEAFNIKTDKKANFNDVSENDWFYKYVTQAKALGVINGDEKGNFNPNDFITRQDITVILYRILKIDISIADTSFSDFEKVSDYAKVAVSYFAKTGVINGMSDGIFAPAEYATRAQCAKIIYGLIK